MVQTTRAALYTACGSHARRAMAHPAGPQVVRYRGVAGEAGAHGRVPDRALGRRAEMGAAAQSRHDEGSREALHGHGCRGGQTHCADEDQGEPRRWMAVAGNRGAAGDVPAIGGGDGGTRREQGSEDAASRMHA